MSPFFIFSCFFSCFSPPRCAEMFCRPVVRAGNLFVGILRRIIFLFFLPKTQHLYFFSSGFWHIFCSCFSSFELQKGRDRSSRGSSPPAACLHTMISLFDSQNHVFVSPSVKPRFKAVCPSLVCELILTQSPFGLSWRGTECKPEHTRSPECHCPSPGTKSISLPFGPCTFFSLQRGQPWHWDPGPERTEDQRRLLHCFCSRCLVKALPLTTPPSNTHTTVSFAVLLLSALW